MEHSEAARSPEKGSSETSSPPPPKNSSEIMRQQLTIFYAGQVAVFDDYPADKAHELIALASKSAPQNQINSNTIHEHHQVSSGTIVCDQSLIVRRRASLCRFLECRKARTKKE